ncbi:MAG: trigger factor [Ruminococcaceae bacterium]|nr:trigger factor [Oscillospiraceae bacterium]
MKKFLFALLACTLILSSCTKYEEPSKDEDTTSESSKIDEQPSEDESEETSEDEYTMFDFSLLSKEELSEFITLGQYKGLESEKVVINITDKDIEDAIKEILSPKAKWEEVKDRTAKEGDKLTVDFKGFMNGEQFDGGTATNQTITIGEGRYIDGFEEGLIGGKLGETVTLNLNFPENYGKEDLNGKPVVFEVTINKIQELILPEITEEIIKEYTKDKCTTEEELKAFLKDELTEESSREKLNLSKNTYWEKAVANATVIKFPENIIEEYVQNYVNYYEQYAAMYGATLEEFLGYTEEKFRSEIKTKAEAYYKEQMVLYAAMYEENFDSNIVESEYNAWLENLAGLIGTTTEALKQQYSVETLQSTYIYEKFIDYIYETRVEVEPKEESSEEASSETASEE